MGARLGRLGIAVLALALGVAGVELVVRQQGLAPTLEFQGLRVRLATDVLYRAEPGGRYGLSRRGYHDREPGPRVAGRRRVLVLGDSFPMGLSLGVDQTLPAALGRALGADFEVLNMGVSGYGPDQSLLRLREDGLALEPDAVLLTVFAANDFEDLRKNELFEPAKDGGLRPTQSNPVSRLLRPLQLWPLLRGATHGAFFPAEQQRALVQTLFRDVYDWALLTRPDDAPARRKRALMRAVLAAFASELAVREVGFGVVVIPSYENVQNDRALRLRGIPPEQYFALERLVVSLCQALEIARVDLREPFLGHPDGRLYDEGDHHLSELGARVAARASAELVRRLLAAPRS